jgi:hypothetical protein
MAVGGTFVPALGPASGKTCALGRQNAKVRNGDVGLSAQVVLRRSLSREGLLQADGDEPLDHVAG